MNNGSIKNERINPFSDSSLSEFKPKTKTIEKPSLQQIDEVAKNAGFPSRESTKSIENKYEKITRRYRTGRNMQLNLKVTPETLGRFYAMADALKLPLVEVFECALKALEDTR